MVINNCSYTEECHGGDTYIVLGGQLSIMRSVAFFFFFKDSFIHRHREREAEGTLGGAAV